MSKSKSFLIVLAFAFQFIHSSLNAQEYQGAAAQNLVKGAEKVIIDPNFSIPAYIKFMSDTEIDFSIWEKWMKSNFKLSQDIGFVLINNEKDNLGFTHYRYAETYQSKIIMGADLVLHVKKGKVSSLNGKLYANLQTNQGNFISEDIALQKALKFVNASTYKWQIPSEEAFIKKSNSDENASYFPKGELMMVPENGNFSSHKYVTAYRFDIYAAKPVSRKYVFVNAFTGETIFALDRIHSENYEINSNATGTAITRYSGTRSFTTDSYNGSYRLRETGRGNGIETYNMLKGTTYSAAVDFTDADNTWNNVNANMDEVAADAHWGAEVTYDFYYTKFNRSSVDNNGFLLKSYVHYDSNYVNAFWDGTQMNYGDGDATHSPLTALDICGHEITHGVTEHTANLIYQAESGALNEGFSDIFGTCIEFYGKPPLTPNWLMGEDIGTPFRSMSNPNAYNQPDTYNGTNWASLTGGDNGGVHTNSGVVNYWFYLLCVGGSGTNDNGAAFTVTTITMDKATAIAYRTLTYYLTSASTYADARMYSLLAVQELYGGCSTEAQQVTNAWHAVGVGAAWVSTQPQSDFNVCPTTFNTLPATVQFNNLSTYSNTFTWYFGDGTTSTLMNPTHNYTANGNYDVKLVSNGGTCGIDSVTKISYISVDPANASILLMPATGTGTTLTTCNGRLYDNGGCGNYTDNTDGTLTIAPIGANNLTLHFNSFSFEDNYDFLYVYNGASTASAQVAGSPFTGSTIPADITSSGGSITLRQTSDQGVNSSGFELEWTCTTPTVPPVANFSANVTATCTGVVAFTDLSTNGPISWLWNFGDGTTSTQQNPIHAYTTNGTYSIMLKVTNNFGNNIDTVLNMVSVSMPNAPTTTSVTHCGAASVTLTATGNATLNWYDAPIGGNLVDTGSTFVTPVLSNITNYYVASETSPASQYTGKTNNTTSGSYNATNQGLIFDCFAAVKLVSVKVYVQTAMTNVVVQLRNSANAVLNSVTIPSIPAGSSRITLNLNLPIANDLRLGVTANTAFYRDNITGGAGYPFTIPGKISIKSSTATQNPTNYYYYYYDWEIKDPNCSSPRVLVTANILDNPVANITPSSNATFCQGDSVILNASTGSGFIYQWFENTVIIPGATNSSYVATHAGNYTVNVSNNCGNLTSNAQSVTVNPVPTTPLVTQTDVSLHSSSPTGNQWYSTPPPTLIVGATNQTFTPTTTGIYYVVVTDSNACSSPASNTVYVVAGINENSNNDFSIIPNPNQGSFKLQLNKSYYGKINLMITNTLGQMVYAKQIDALPTQQISLNSLENGVYFLNIRNENMNITRRLVIEK
ncbi:MAG: M4 family metallopeptidase [Bacteroidota bacterium]